MATKKPAKKTGRIGPSKPQLLPNAMRVLSAAQKQICSLVGSGMTQRDAGASVGVDETTVCNWFRDTNGLGGAMAEATKEYADRFASEMLAQAQKTLSNLLKSDNEQIQVQAADVVLKRLAAIEKRMGDREKLSADREAKAASLQLDREKFAAGQMGDDSHVPGVVVVPPDSDEWQKLAVHHD